MLEPVRGLSNQIERTDPEQRRYVQDAWAARGSLAHGFQGWSIHTSMERRFDRIELRGGARYTGQHWNPTGGVGLNLSRRVSIDLAAYGTTANLQLERRLALATSLRVKHEGVGGESDK